MKKLEYFNLIKRIILISIICIVFIWFSLRYLKMLILVFPVTTYGILKYGINKANKD